MRWILPCSALKKGKNGSQRHVSGQELLEGFRDYALAQFGPMASTVMKEWGLRNGKNVGEMVFLLIEEDVFPNSRRIPWMISRAS